MRSLSLIYLRGARRIVSRVTYEILLVGILLAVLPTMLLLALFRNSDKGLLVAAVIVAIWLWVVRTFVKGALAIAATERPGLSKSAPVLRATLQRLGTFLCISLILVLGELAILLLLLFLAVVGFGGRVTAPILGLLTPVFLVGGAAGLLALVALHRLAFPAAACDPSVRASGAIRKARSLFRRRLASVVLWLSAELALVVGMIVAVVLPALIGAASGVSLQALFFLGSLNDDTNTSGGVAVGGVFWLISLAIFVLLVLGGVFSFSVGSAVAFFECDGAVPVADPAPPVTDVTQMARLSFCDQCGRPQPPGSPFCDVCGSKLVLA